MDELPVPPFAQSLIEWETLLQIMQMIVAAGVFLFFAAAIGAIYWLATHQHQTRLHHPNNPYSLL